MQKHVSLILGELIWFGVARMVDAWLPHSPGWFWAAVTAIGVLGLVGFYSKNKWLGWLRVGKQHRVDAGPTTWKIETSQPTVTLTPPPWRKPILRVRSIWRRRMVKWGLKP